FWPCSYLQPGPRKETCEDALILRQDKKGNAATCTTHGNGASTGKQTVFSHVKPDVGAGRWHPRDPAKNIS
ncbi:hypothetical protein BV898_15107, partial [Hypsibius exemplaris]